MSLRSSVILFTLQQLDEKVKTRPQGYREEVLSQATKRSDGFYELPPEVFAALAEKYRAPTLVEKLTNLGEAAIQLAKDPTARSIDEIKEVTAICRKCPWLVENGFKCGQCGCVLRVKTIGRAFHCPIGKW